MTPSQDPKQWKHVCAQGGLEEGESCRRPDDGGIGGSWMMSHVGSLCMRSQGCGIREDESWERNHGG